MKIASLAQTPFEVLAEAFGRAFAEYEVQISPDELRTMLRRRGFDPALSFAAFDNSDRIAAFTLNGIGTFGGGNACNAGNGVPTAYDTGTGTLPDYRSQGLATQIFEASLPHLRAAGIRQYLLEVLQHNTAAVSVYRRLGFEVSREFHYFRAATDEITPNSALPPSISLLEVTPAAVREAAPDFWDFTPSWQNSFDAIERSPEDFVTLAAFDSSDGHNNDGSTSDRQTGSSSDTPAGNLVGYIVFEPAAGDITQIAVAKNDRRRGIASALLAEMLRRTISPTVKCINTEIGRDESIAAFLQARNIPLAGKQFEMIKTL